MKLNILFFVFLFLSCQDNAVDDQDVISKEEFQKILKDVHLVEAKFDLNKVSNYEDSRNILESDYQEIYKKHNISDERFKESIDYYSERPDLLYDIYSNILEDIKTERESIFQ